MGLGNLSDKCNATPKTGSGETPPIPPLCHRCRGGPVREHPARFRAAGLAVVSLLLAAACSSNSGDAKNGGTTITMWTRAGTAPASTRLVKAYNATHKNQVKLTVIPTDNYQPRIAAAAGA